MSHASLTTRYRPQTFGEAAGQEIIKTILSKAAQEDRVAAAYLFSGTRGVGKTTFARIFAKALNCAKAPTAEPCNECESCRKITAGMAVDVLEMDGASNRGIEDAKRLREVVNYAPMEGRYKIFIIDEAHMLSRDAFNALLKTIEEPPPRVTFIMATTEPHKFPATIVSRCQHFVFKRLNNPELEAHLTSILEREGAAFDHEAVALIARRAAGSVRDGMSLLGQVLALGGERLSVAAVRNTLGLAGEDLFLSLLQAVREEDSLAALNISKAILDQGVDMGFFLRELSAMWRNLFMLRQAGAASAKALDMTAAEAEIWLGAAANLPLAHIHASWQMTLEGQRRVLNALEPAQALELLLLNLTVLPALIPVQDLPNAPLPDTPPAGGLPPQAGAKSAPGIAKAGTNSAREAPTPSRPASESAFESTPKAAPVAAPEQSPDFEQAAALGPAEEEKVFPADPRPWDDIPPDADIPPMSEALDQDLSSDTGFTALTDPMPRHAARSVAPEAASEASPVAAPGTAEEVPPASPETPLKKDASFTPPAFGWDDFLRFCREKYGADAPGGASSNFSGHLNERELVLTFPSQLALDRFAPEELNKLSRALGEFLGREYSVVLAVSDKRHKTRQELREEALKNPKVLLLQTQLKAGLLDCRDLRK